MTYYFGNSQLDIARRELRRNGDTLHVRPKVFDVLVHLLEHRDRVVSKDELLEAVWPGRIISETTLTACLKELRKTLQDTGKEKQIIKTIHGKGYRFIAELISSSAIEQESPIHDDRRDNAAPAVSEKSESGPEDAGRVPDQSQPVLISGVRSNPPTGANQSISTPEFRGERKAVSALRCGLISPDELVDQIGHEQMHYLLQELFDIAKDVVERYNGQITQWLDDGFLALFGASIALDDHARRALLAAFEIRKNSRSLCNTRQAALGTGLTSGHAIISHVPGNPQQLHTARGTAVKLVETLRWQASSNQILLSQKFYQLVRADVRASAINAAAGILVAEQIRTPQAGVPRRFRRYLAPLIGRDDEINLMRQRLKQTIEGHGQAVVISGSPGIGKSRVLAEFRSHLVSQPFRCVQANCFAHWQGTPYYPLIEYTRQICGIDEDDADETIQLKVKKCVTKVGLDESLSVPLLMRLIDGSHTTTQVEGLSTQAQRKHTTNCLIRLTLDSEQPTVVIVEDFHWVDASTRDWLEVLIQQLSNYPILLIITSRPEAELYRLQHRGVTTLALQQLTEEQSKRLLYSLPRASSLQSQFPELISRSGGNPFFLEELALSVSQSKQTQQVPDTIHGVLASRIDQLTIEDKILLQAAAIIGQRGSLSLLAAVCDLENSDLAHAMLRLQLAELLFSTFASGEEQFVFKHALVQEVAYASQLDHRRRKYHRRIADTLRRDFAPVADRQPETLAWHYEKSGNYCEAVVYWQRAGRRACERSAYIETIDYIRQGIRLLKHFEDPDSRASRELGLQRTLGPAQMASLGYGAIEVESTWTRARSLCEQLNDNASLFRVLVGLSTYYWVNARFNQAYSCNIQLLKLARRSENESFELRANAAMGELLLHAGRYRSAQRYLERCSTLTATEPSPRLSVQSASVTASCYSAWLYWFTNKQAQAQKYADEALDCARTFKQPLTLAIALCLIAEFNRYRGDWKQALHLAQEGVELSRRQSFPFWLGSTLVTLGWAEASSGKGKQGIATTSHGIEVFQSTGARVQMPSWLGALADTYRINGDEKSALIKIEEALRWAGNTGDRYYVPRLQKLKASLNH